MWATRSSNMKEGGERAAETRFRWNLTPLECSSLGKGVTDAFYIIKYGKFTYITTVPPSLHSIRDLPTYSINIETMKTVRRRKALFLESIGEQTFQESLHSTANFFNPFPRLPPPSFPQLTNFHNK